MGNMKTVTVRELRHNFVAVEKAARAQPVKVTRRGKVIGVFTTKSSRSGKWTPPDLSTRSRAIVGDRLAGLDVRDFIG